MMSFYVVIRGPLGAGKSVVSHRLAEAIRASYISVDVILEAENLEQWDEDKGCISEESFLRANRFIGTRAQASLHGGIPAVIDGNFYWRSAIEDLLFRLPFPHLVVTLRAPLSVCIARDARRDPSHGREATRQVYARTTSFEYGTTVDATVAIGSVVSSILKELRRNGMRGI